MFLRFFFLVIFQRREIEMHFVVVFWRKVNQIQNRTLKTLFLFVNGVLCIMQKKRTYKKITFKKNSIFAYFFSFHLWFARVCLPMQNTLVVMSCWQQTCFSVSDWSQGAMHESSAWFGQMFMLNLLHTPCQTGLVR